MSFISELRRRNVIRVGAAYLVASWLVIQVAETLFPLFGYGDRPARLVVIVLAIGLIPALVCAWAFRLTPEGLRKEAVDGAADPLPPDSKRFDRLIMVVLAIAVAYFAIDRFVFAPDRESASRQRQEAALEQARLQGRGEALANAYGDRSIAVLPFLNTSDDPANEYFSDGISEELLSLLSRVPGLRVISRTSAFAYKGTRLTMARVAEELNVAHVLEGTVRKSGNRVRVSARLIDARSDTQLWSEVWDEALDDIFAVQEQIASQVVEQLRVRLMGPAPRPVETGPEAYALYLQARYLSGQGTPEGYAQAAELLREVLEADPRYTPAWDALASNYINQAGKGLVGADEGFGLARDAAGQALAIDPDFGPAHARLGYVAMLHDNDPAAAAQHYRRALELAPGNLSILSDASALLKHLGRFEQCIALDEYFVARDPVSTSGHYNLGGSYLFAGRYQDAVETFNVALRLSPNRVGAHFQLGIARLLTGDASGALAEFEQEPLDVLRRIGLPLAYFATGDVPASDRALDELIGTFSRDAAYNIAYVFAYRGETDRAFEWLEKAVEYADPGLAELAVEPLFANLRGDARWVPLLESLGQAPGQLGAIDFEVQVPSG